MVVNQVLLLLLKPQPYVPAKTFATNCSCVASNQQLTCCIRLTRVRGLIEAPRVTVAHQTIDPYEHLHDPCFVALVASCLLGEVGEGNALSRSVVVVALAALCRKQ